jgi:hypothetical protein
MENKDYLRYTKEWEIGPGMSETAARANALFQFLVNTDELKAADEDTQERFDRLQKRKFQLEKELQDDSDPAPAKLTQLEQINQEIEEIQGEYSDVYDLEVMDDDYLGGLTWFEIEKIEKAYVVGDEYDMEKAALEYIEQLYDDIGFDSLPDWLAEKSIDTDSVVESFRMMYEDWINESPEDYLEDSDRELSQEQKHEVEKRDFVSKDLNKKVKAFKLAQQNETDSEKLSFIKKTISLFETKLAQLESQKEKILEDPQGEFSEDVIEREIEARLEYVKERPLQQLKDYGMEIDSYIDKRKVYQEVLDNDGFEVMSGYDGEVNEEIVNGDTFYIIRIE